MNDTKKFSLLWGVFFFLFGLLLLTKTLGVFQLMFLDLLVPLWPVLLILSGLALMMKHQKISVSILLLCLLLVGVGGFQHSVSFTAPIKELRTTLFTIPFERGTDYVDLTFSFGTAYLFFGGTESSSLATTIVHTHLQEDPLVYYTSDASKGRVLFQQAREGSFFHVGKRLTETWYIDVTRKVLSSLHFEGGSLEGVIDLRKATVGSVDLSAQHVDLEFILSRFATDVKIDAAYGDITFAFPEDIGVELRVTKGSVSVDLPDFVLVRPGVYVSENYGSSTQRIVIDIAGGVLNVAGVITS